MKRLLITTALVASVGISGFAYANHHDTEMRHQQSAKFSVKQMVKQLRGLSLTEAQKSDIKSLVTQFKHSMLQSNLQNSLNWQHCVTIFLPC